MSKTPATSWTRSRSLTSGVWTRFATTLCASWTSSGRQLDRRRLPGALCRGMANGLGNLVNRSLSMLKRYRSGVVPPPHHELAPEAERAVRETVAHLCGAQLQAALQSIWLLVTRANQYVDQTAPFKLAKDTRRPRGC